MDDEAAAFPTNDSVANVIDVVAGSGVVVVVVDDDDDISISSPSQWW